MNRRFGTRFPTSRRHLNDAPAWFPAHPYRLARHCCGDCDPDRCRRTARRRADGGRQRLSALGCPQPAVRGSARRQPGHAVLGEEEGAGGPAEYRVRPHRRPVEESDPLHAARARVEASRHDVHQLHGQQLAVLPVARVHLHRRAPAQHRGEDEHRAERWLRRVPGARRRHEDVCSHGAQGRVPHRVLRQVFQRILATPRATESAGLGSLGSRQRPWLQRLPLHDVPGRKAPHVRRQAARVHDDRARQPGQPVHQLVPPGPPEGSCSRSLRSRRTSRESRHRRTRSGSPTSGHRAA